MKSLDKKQLPSKQRPEQIDFSALSDSSFDLMDDDLPSMLLEHYHQLKEVKYTLRPGMIVTWKPGLKNREMSDYGKPSIVVSVLETPVFDEEKSSGSTYFRELLDIEIGVFLDDGDFLVYHTSSERFKPWNGKEL